MESTECENIFTNVENGLPEKDGKYKVIAKTESKWNGGIFITLMDFRNPGIVNCMCCRGRWEVESSK